MIPSRPLLQRLTIEGPAGGLEAIVEEPVTRGSCYAVVCHPHPLFGGTMDNKVVTSVCRAMHDVNVATLRFNFRGVGQSEGAFAHGVGETDDARAVADWGARRWPGRQMMLAGFSFGSYVALRLAQACPAVFLITIAPPVQRFDFSSMAVPNCPWLIVQGDADELVDAAGVLGWAGALVPRPALHMMPGVGHFFHGRLEELRDAIRVAVRKAAADAAPGG